MRIGIVGRKCGMTRVFTEDGVSIPVTVVEASPNHITQLSLWQLMAIQLFRSLQVPRKLPELPSHRLASLPRLA